MDGTDCGPVLWTLGHSNRDLEEYLDLLESFSIDRIVDVRSHPHSRRFPHFSEGNLKDSLREEDVDYEHWEKLGGRRSPKNDSSNTALDPGFQAVADHLVAEDGQQVLDQLEDSVRSRDGSSTALMCAEKDPQRCHRKLIADHLTARGLSVHHAVDPNEDREHDLHSNARVKGETVTYPGLV